MRIQEKKVLQDKNMVTGTEEHCENIELERSRERHPQNHTFDNFNND